MRCDAERCIAVWCGALLCNAVRCHAMRQQCDQHGDRARHGKRRAAYRQRHGCGGLQGGAIVVCLFHEHSALVAVAAPAIGNDLEWFCAPAPPLAAELARVASAHVDAALYAAAHVRATTRAKAAPPRSEHGVRELQLH